MEKTKLYTWSRIQLLIIVPPQGFPLSVFKHERMPNKGNVKKEALPNSQQHKLIKLGEEILETCPEWSAPFGVVILTCSFCGDAQLSLCFYGTKVISTYFSTQYQCKIIYTVDKNWVNNQQRKNLIIKSSENV